MKFSFVSPPKKWTLPSHPETSGELGLLELPYSTPRQQTLACILRPNMIMPAIAKPNQVGIRTFRRPAQGQSWGVLGKITAQINVFMENLCQTKTGFLLSNDGCSRDAVSGVVSDPMLGALCQSQKNVKTLDSMSCKNKFLSLPQVVP